MGYNPFQANPQATGNPLGFPTNATQDYFEKNPTDAFQVYVNRLGGQASPLGRYAAQRFNEVYGDFLQQSARNPSLLWTNYLNQYSQGGHLGQDFQGTAPALRGQQYQWSQGRFLG